jgi:hypothetical protein
MDMETNKRARAMMDGEMDSEGESAPVEDRVESLEERVTRLEAKVVPSTNQPPKPKIKPSKGKNDTWPGSVAV